MVFPGMVYISHPTEYGTLYSKAELEALSAVCHTYICPSSWTAHVWVMRW